MEACSPTEMVVPGAPCARGSALNHRGVQQTPILAYIYIYIWCMYRWLVLAHAGTYGARKYRSWCTESTGLKIQNPKIKTPKTPKCKTPEIHTQSELCSCFLDFWISRFWDFGTFGFFGFLDLWLCGYLSTKKCISACREGGGERICTCICS